MLCGPNQNGFFACQLFGIHFVSCLVSVDNMKLKI